MFSQVLALLVALSSAHADTNLTIIHSSDLHSHFTNRYSQHKLGGFARLKTKVDEVRARSENSLFLDAGDWSEANIFFTLQSGVATQELMNYMGYDAMVLGNHDWLAGPFELYDAFSKSGLTVPVLSANIDFSKLPPGMDLSQWIKPYIIKDIGGKKVAIVGLSTFEVVFDHFFRPVEVKNPVLRAHEIVKRLRKEERVDHVIVLSHLGIHFDKLVAKFVKGIDFIIGGHTHLLLKRPAVVNGVPIFHVGKWGHYLGEYNFVLPEKGKARFVSTTLHEIKESIVEEPIMKGWIEGFTSDVEELFHGPVFTDRIVKSEVDLPVSVDISNDFAGNTIVDGIRNAARAEVALDLPFYYAQDLYRGDLSTVDFFNMTPHVWSSATKKSWTIYTWEVKGFALEILLEAMSKANFAVKISNGSFEVDKRKLLPVRNVRIGGEPIKLFKSYRVASTRGVLDIYREFKRRGIDLKVKNVSDTGIEAWRAAAAQFASLSPVTPDKVKWDPRIRIIQPDLYLPGERVQFDDFEDRVEIRFQFVNQGLKPVVRPRVWARVDATPESTLDDLWTYLPVTTEIEGGKFIESDEFVNAKATWPVARGARKGVYSTELKVEVIDGEGNTKNNYYESHIRAQ